MTVANVKYRKDYKPSNLLIHEVRLDFQLYPEHTIVKSVLSMAKNPAAPQSDSNLQLDGEELELLSVAINGQAINNYQQNEQGLLLSTELDEFELAIETKIFPQQNTSLEGLYQSSGKYCTQCEAEGFRKITYYLDRPDVMALFTTRIEADKAQFPYLLSNGNKIDSGDLDGGRHFAVWQDPFKKPSYLFALVAGDYDLLTDSFITKSGREVALEIYVDKGKLDQCHHAMESLKRSMQWDEQRFNLEYDLDIYMIVAVGDFNMGAMENKGLNVFNTKYVLANEHTATDKDYIDVEAVIGHEYFHNWTGNRVTCRDWFQHSLKEGLTVFRDQEFTSDLHDRAVKRIEDVKVLRAHQFAEDAGPMAHPVRPDSYIEMNNFYTVTVYNKGAEVIRMMHTILGEENFQQGMALYFERHDGQAVTCEDFVRAMEDASGIRLQTFRNWYRQAGTPEVKVTSRYNSKQQTLELELTQSLKNDGEFAPFHIPLKFGLLDQQGNELTGFEVVGADYHNQCIHLKDKQCKLTINGVTAEPNVSWLRDFSAPVKLTSDMSLEQHLFMMAHDNNAFSRWESSQQVMQAMLLAGSESELYKTMQAPLIEAFGQTLNNQNLGAAFRALMLRLPDISYLMELAESLNIEALCKARDTLEMQIAEALQRDFLQLYRELVQQIEQSSAEQARSLRSLKNLCLHYLTVSQNQAGLEICQQQWQSRNNMTDAIAAMGALVQSEWQSEAKQTIDEFYNQWHHEALVMDKWFAVQAQRSSADALETVKDLVTHELFSYTNPNRVRSVVVSFAYLNPKAFHRADGAGYRWVGEQVKTLDGLNPQVAARVVSAFNRWRLFDEQRQQLIQQVLEDILAQKTLSKDVFEIVSKALSM